MSDESIVFDIIFLLAILISIFIVIALVIAFFVFVTPTGEHTIKSTTQFSKDFKVSSRYGHKIDTKYFLTDDYTGRTYEAPNLRILNDLTDGNDHKVTINAHDYILYYDKISISDVIKVNNTTLTINPRNLIKYVTYN